MTLADRVVVMNGGRIEQVGTPQELYHHPKTRFVAGFIGSPTMNFVPCRLDQNGSGLTLAIAPKLTFPVPEERCARYRPFVGKHLVFGLRPEHITEPRGSTSDERCQFQVVLDVVEPMGMETVVFFLMEGAQICGRVEPTSAKNSGEAMQLYANLKHMHLIDPQTEAVL
jgi:multiple sugar transport system ATP-binding protein